MPRSSPLIHRLFVLLVYLILQVIALVLIINNSYFQQSVLMRSLRGLQYSSWERQSSIRNYLSLRSTNNALSKENVELRNRLVQLEALEESSLNNPIADSLGRTFPDFKFVAAEIIHNTTHRAHNYLIINKGSVDGLASDMGVVCNNGVVGIITHTSPHYSMVISLLNTDQKLSVRLKNEGSCGTLQWNGSNSAEAGISDLLSHVHTQIGDTVVTSGFSTLFPAGIPIGSISDISVRKGIYLDLKVSFFEKFEQLQYVNVAIPLFPEEIENLKPDRNE